MVSKKTEREYRVVAEVMISMSTIVTASSAKEAFEKARQQPSQQLCHQCATGEPEQEWVTGGEFDGTPTKLKAYRRKHADDE